MRDTEQLPVKMLVSVFDHLQPSSLFKAAAVCAHWRRVAKQHDNCHGAVSIDTSSWWLAAEREGKEAHRAFLTSIDNARATNTRLNVSLKLVYHPWGDKREILHTAQSVLDAAGSCVSLIRQLDVELPGLFACAFFAAVCEAPAPALQRFRLSVYGSCDVIPSTLFVGQAPSLSSVALEGQAALPTRPVAAFSQATSVVLKLDDDPSFSDIPRHFPNVLHLACRFPRSRRAAEHPLDAQLRSRLRSLSLTVETKPVDPLTPQTELDSFLASCNDVPSVGCRLEGPQTGSIQSLFEHFPGPISLVLHLNSARERLMSSARDTDVVAWLEAGAPVRGEQFAVDITRVGRTRVVAVDTLQLDWCARQMAAIRPQITEVRIWHHFIARLEGCVELLSALPALSQLHVNLSDYDARSPTGGEGSLPAVEVSSAMWPALTTLCFDAWDLRTDVQLQNVAQYVDTLRLTAAVDRPTLLLSEGLVQDARQTPSLQELFAEILPATCAHSHSAS